MNAAAREFTARPAVREEPHFARVLKVLSV
jgi:hypothetical protein